MFQNCEASKISVTGIRVPDEYFTILINSKQILCFIHYLAWMSAPHLTSVSATLRWPARAAKCNAVFESSSSSFVMFLLRLTSSRTMLKKVTLLRHHNLQIHSFYMHNLVKNRKRGILERNIPILNNDKTKEQSLTSNLQLVDGIQ